MHSLGNDNDDSFEEALKCNCGLARVSNTTAGTLAVERGIIFL